MKPQALCNWANNTIGKYVTKRRIKEIRKAVKKTLKLTECDIKSNNSKTSEGEILYRGLTRLYSKSSSDQGI